MFTGLALSSAPSAAASTAAETETITQSASAGPARGFWAVSHSTKAKISGTYQYWYAGRAGGRALYDGRFMGATAEDRVAGDKYQAVLALKYDEFVGGAWRPVKNRVAVVNGTKSWSFKNKANVVAYACDRKVGTKKLLNCDSWSF
ncbi:hypothetical protein ACFYO5_35610 [Streptomyces sp. NPDC006259]|uniref:hypothetical protein n=1 Tax=Streptomyces sp. NPDC006259 TaxID=3364740 RepID=UPI00367D27C9